MKRTNLARFLLFSFALIFATFILPAISGCGGGGGGSASPDTTGTVRGTVTGQSGSPLSGAEVSIGSATATTDSDGKYTLSGIPGGSRTLTAKCSGYQDYNVSVQVTAGQAVDSSFQMTLLPQTGSVSGKVTNTSQAPLANANVKIGDVSARSAQDGSYTLTGIPAGSRTITATMAGYVNLSETVEVQAGQAATRNLVMSPIPPTTGSISGIVSSSGGAPISGVLMGAGNITDTTDSNGAYSLGGVPSGGNTLLAGKTGYLNQSIAVTVTAGQDLVRNVTLSSSTLSFQNFDSDNGSYTSGGTSSSWQWGTPTAGIGPGAAYSLPYCWGTNLSGDYNNSESSTLTSPAVNLSSLSGKGQIKLSWRQWLRTEPSNDTARVQVSNDNGSSWTDVYGPASGDVDTAWTERSVILENTYAVSNFRVRFYLNTNASTTMHGWYIDDVKVEQHQPTFYALITGINDYPGTGSDLSYCINDASDIRASLQQCPGWWGHSQITYLTDSAVNVGAIHAGIDQVKAAAGPGDCFIFFYSGHGTNEVGNAALAVWDGAGWGFVTDSDMQSWMTGMPCPSTIILDTCFSGGMMGRSVIEGAKAKVYTGAPGFDPYFDKGWIFHKGAKALDALDNLVGLAACTGTELSWELQSLQNGVFTYYVTQGLGSGTTIGPADTSGDGAISAEEAYNYASPLVTSTVSSQHPQMVDNYPTAASHSSGLKIKF
jgi:hypothetical protein